MKVCKIGGCERKHKAKGYCSKHYLQLLRHGKVLNRTKYDKNKIVIKGDIAEVVLYNIKNKEVARTIIDSKNINKINQFKWRLTDGYAKTDLAKKTVCMPSVIMDSEEMFDHKDHHKLNNRETNLRVCTYSQNSMNRSLRENTSSEYKGVCWDIGVKKWRASIVIKKKNVYLGIFVNIIDAAKAYNKAAQKAYGEFAFLNNIKEIACV